jgi:hypothetical protein
MKNAVLAIAVTVLSGLGISISARAQESQGNSKFGISTDLFSNYVWRGTRYGTGPAVQPGVKYETGGLILGVWGSFDFSGYSEADPYVSYSFPFGLSLGMTDYYYPGLSLFDFSRSSGSNAIEINLGYSTGDLSLSGNFILNEAGGAGSQGGDLYFQLGYSIGNADLFMGAGNGWHTSDGEFNLCNIGLSVTRDIHITDSFSIPLIGQVILNPEREQLFIVAGFSF